MEKYITDERTGLRYELIGDIYYLAGDDEPEAEPEAIGIWGQRHLRYIREHRPTLYSELIITGKLNGYLADIEQQAEDMLLRLVNDMTQTEGVTEQLKAENQMEWIQKQNNIKQRVMEILFCQLINN